MVTLDNPKDVPFGPLSPNTQDNLIVGSERWRAPINFIYGRLVNNAVNRNLLMNAKYKTVAADFKTAIKSELDKNSSLSLRVGFLQLINQSEPLKNLLLGTKDKTIEFMSQDPILGVGANRQGKNMVGAALMQLRHELMISHKDKQENLQKQARDQQRFDSYMAYQALNILLDQDQDITFQKYLDKTPADIVSEVGLDRIPIKDRKLILDFYEKNSGSGKDNIFSLDSLSTQQLIDLVRKEEIRSFASLQEKRKRDVVLNIYTDYILETEYFLSPEKFQKAKEQQFDKIGYYTLNKLRDEAWKLFLENKFPPNLQLMMDNEVSLIYVPSDMEIKLVEDGELFPEQVEPNFDQENLHESIAQNISQESSKPISEFIDTFLIPSVTASSFFEDIIRYETIIKDTSSQQDSLKKSNTLSSKLDTMRKTAVLLKDMNASQQEIDDIEDAIKELETQLDEQKDQEAEQKENIKQARKTMQETIQQSINSIKDLKKELNKLSVHSLETIGNLSLYDQEILKAEIANRIRAIKRQRHTGQDKLRAELLVSSLEHLTYSIDRNFFSQVMETKKRSTQDTDIDETSTSIRIFPYGSKASTEGEGKYDSFSPFKHVSMLHIDGLVFPTVMHYLMVGKLATILSHDPKSSPKISLRIKQLGKKNSYRFLFKDSVLPMIPDLQDFDSIKDINAKYSQLNTDALNFHILQGVDYTIDLILAKKENQELLLLTGNDQIYYGSAETNNPDHILGIGSKDSPGRNYWGLALMKARDELSQNDPVKHFINKKDILSSLKSDSFLKAWCSSRISDCCNVINLFRSYMLQKYSVSPDLSSEFVELIVDSIYMPCSSLFSNAKKLNIETPLHVEKLIINLLSDTHSLSNHEEEDLPQGEQFVFEDSTELEDASDNDEDNVDYDAFAQLLEDEMTQQDLPQKKKETDPNLTLVAQIIWSRVYTLLDTIVVNSKLPSIESTAEVIVKCMTWLSDQKDCLPIIIGDKQSNCTYLALVNLLKKTQSILEQLKLDTTLNSFDVELASSILLEKDLLGDVSFSVEELSDDLPITLLKTINLDIEKVLKDNSYDDSLVTQLAGAIDIVDKYPLPENIKIGRIKFYSLS